MTENTNAKRKNETADDHQHVNKKIESGSLLQILFHTKISYFTESHQDKILYVAHRDAKVTEVFQSLIQHNFTSAPILRKNQNKFMGFLDLADVLQCIVHHFGRERLEKSEDFWKLMQQEDIFQKRTVNDIVVHPISKRNPFVDVKREHSVRFAAEILAREQHIHHIPIIDNNRHLIAILSRSRIVRFLYDHIDKFSDLYNLPVSNMSLSTVTSIHENEETIRAFQKMIEHSTQGIAVVDNLGKLVNNISLRDLKLVASDCRMFWRLYQRVGSFLTKVKEDEKEMRPKEVVTCRVNETLGDVFEKVVKTNVHHLYVIDDHQRPTHMITLRDLILSVLTRLNQ
eukprot:TRINITY_DN5189_c0_g1_i1.p1 TRINITY_DN5189_c0_g1~~TRINITY_DN5189_c0_g1_i1.p1  ORF type:complete len:342 (+),score=54.64 TRINITY_DN5189_c0_g1_i1:7-1032(+)